MAAGCLLGAVVLAGVVLGDGDDTPGLDVDDRAEETASEVEQAVFTGLSVPESVPEVTATVPTTSPVEKTVIDRTLTKGLAGDDVRQMQARLAELGFAVGTIDGIYGDLTRQAVWAYEKLVLKVPRDEPTGEVTPAMWERMQDPFVIQPRRPGARSADHTEVYLPEQVVAIFHDDVPVMIAHISSGDGQDWCEEVVISPGEWGNEDGDEPIKRGECGKSITPGGVFEFNRQVEGVRESALGGMLNPVYFNYGIAIHGAFNVPLYPASHGCIRLANDLSDEMQDLVELGDKVFVWDGVRQPEEHTEESSLPYFNRADPDYTTTTTTSTTTSTTSTTLVAETTVPEAAPPTVEPPASTDAPSPATTRPATASTTEPATSSTPVASTTSAPATSRPTTTSTTLASS